MDKTPLLLAAAHTVGRRVGRGSIRIAASVAKKAARLAFLCAYVPLAATISLALLFFTMAGLLVPEIIGIQSFAPSHCFVCEEHPGLLFQNGAPTAAGLLIYAAAVLGSYAAVFSLSSKRPPSPMTSQAPASQRRVWAALAWGGDAYIAFMAQAFSMQFLGRGRLLAAPFTQGWKLVLSGVALPMHMAAMLAMLAAPMGKGIAASGSALLRLRPPSLGSALERLASESPEILARHEAKALGQASPTAAPARDKPRL